MDNVFVERLRRSVKYERVYLHAFETGARAGIGRWGDHYNSQRPRSSLGERTLTKAHEGVRTLHLAI